MIDQKIEDNLRESKLLQATIEKLSDKRRKLDFLESECHDFLDYKSKLCADLTISKLSAKDQQDLEEIALNYQRSFRLIGNHITEKKEKLQVKEAKLLQKQDELYFERQNLLMASQSKNQRERKLYG